MSDLITALRNADAAGDTEAAKRIAAMIRDQQALSKPEGTTLDAIAAPVAAVASGAIAEPVSGLLGLASAGGRALGLDMPEGGDAVRAVQEALAFQPETIQGQESVESLMGAIDNVVKTARLPAASAAFLREFIFQQISGGDTEKATERFTIARNEGVGRELGERAQDFGATPSVSAALETIPTALAEVATLGVPASAGRGLSKLADKAEEKGRDFGSIGVEPAKSAEEALVSSAEAIKGGKPESLVAEINPDPQFFSAIDELGISSEPMASFASKNPQFRAIEQGLASIPASQLDAQSKAFISELSGKADDIISAYGGTTDKAQLSDAFRADSIATIDGLSDQVDKLYDDIAMKIPASSRVEAPSTVSFITSKASELGGRKELPPVLNRVLRQLETKTKTVPSGRRDISGRDIPGKTTTTKPTHERLNQTRKEIGQALNRGTGPFKDQETGLLKALYRRLREDQDAVADSFGAADISEAANGMVRQRKHLEDNLAALLGKDLSGSIMPKVGAAMKGLARGEVEKWDSVMRKIPSSMRKQVVISSLNDIFRGANVGGQSLNVTQFTKFMDELERSPATKKRLYKELPADSIQALENLRKVSKGVSIALQDRIPTGRVAALFEGNDGFLRRMMGKAITTAATMKGGPLMGAAASEFMSQSTGGSKAASAVLASPQFQNIIRTAVKDGVIDGAEASDRLRKAEAQFAKSKQYKRWAKALDESERAKLGSVGVSAYLLQDEER